MAWTPYVGDGTTVFLDTGAAWTEIRGLKNFAIGAPTKNKVNQTELRSSVTSEIGGKVTFGDITFDLMFSPDDTTHLAIETSANTAGSSDRMYVKYPGANHYVLYAGSFGGLAESFQQDDNVIAQVTFTLSAVPTRSTSAPAA